MAERPRSIMTVMLFVRSTFVIVAAAVLLTAACSDDGAESPVSPTVLPSLTIQDLITSASSVGIAAAVRSGVPPAPQYRVRTFCTPVHCFPIEVIGIK